MKYLNETIGFVGAGNMASALISGLINSDHNASKIIASSPEREHIEKLSKEFGIKTTNNNLDVIDIADILILAVKPNIVQAVIDEIKDVAIDKDIPLCCEVNTQPLNQISIDFHENLGFCRVGEFAFDDHQVAYFIKEHS